ncbi:hypothetical protein [Halomonas sp. BC04]|uniref:hypothetical protein n=1 Tax=Halomonas sp. BC04 TaxID=1403540 RepID=UPI0003ED8044|nr:hypothetical protein [Halomonas sp. BC04]EWG97882.1 hypothetical protein Q427_33550 [Halomonas sp. BC04]
MSKQVLEELVGAWRPVLRHSDLLARIGGGRYQVAIAEKATLTFNRLVARWFG